MKVLTPFSIGSINNGMYQILMESTQFWHILHKSGRCNYPGLQRAKKQNKTKITPHTHVCLQLLLFSISFIASSYSTSSVIPQGFSLLTGPIRDLIQYYNSRHTNTPLTSKVVSKEQAFFLSYRPYFPYFELPTQFHQLDAPRAVHLDNVFQKGIHCFPPVNLLLFLYSLPQFMGVIRDFSLSLESHIHSKLGQFYLLHTPQTCLLLPMVTVLIRHHPN